MLQANNSAFGLSHLVICPVGEPIMSRFLEGPLARPRPEPDQARTLEMLATLLITALAVATLYLGREIFIPIAIAIPVSFVLSPPVLLLRRCGLGRVPSVL